MKRVFFVSLIYVMSLNGDPLTLCSQNSVGRVQRGILVWAKDDAEAFRLAEAFCHGYGFHPEACSVVAASDAPLEHLTEVEYVYGLPPDLGAEMLRRQKRQPVELERALGVLRANGELIKQGLFEVDALEDEEEEEGVAA